MAALTEHGPCPEHRSSFVNVKGVIRARAGLPPDSGLPPAAADEERASEEAELSYG
jgi:hypothetical protein